MKFFDFNKVEYDAVIQKDIDREKKTMTMIVTKLNFQRNISTDFIILIYFHQRKNYSLCLKRSPFS